MSLHFYFQLLFFQVDILDIHFLESIFELITEMSKKLFSSLKNLLLQWIHH